MSRGARAGSAATTDEVRRAGRAPGVGRRRREERAAIWQRGCRRAPPDRSPQPTCLLGQPPETQAMRASTFGALLLLAACGGVRLEDRTTAPALPVSALEVVADLDYPPGNIPVSSTRRVFFPLHPNGDPPIKLVELVGGKPVPYPDEASQTTRFDSPLAVRIDRQGRLWTLDFARYGRGQPRLVAFDLATNTLVHQYDFPSSVAGFLSMVNDFQVDPRGEKIYIAETR